MRIALFIVLLLGAGGVGLMLTNAANGGVVSADEVVSSAMADDAGVG